MREEDSELIARIYADWERGDFSASDWAAPDIEFTAADGPAPGTWIGKHEMGLAWREILGAWDELTTQVEEIRPLDGGRVLVLTLNGGRGKTSGLELGEMTTHRANLLWLAQGKVTKLVAYWDRAGAFSDLGMT